jgi:prepilin-type N-terminal cleavage/methylation domain-containing protein/prepilin-type processing-associated H-X9-DG protein
MGCREKRIRCAKAPSGGRESESASILHQSSFINRHGFTLIELLVVISIIALLLAVLLPVAGRVRKQAVAVACRARLRQWGLAFKMYTDGNDGRWFTAYRPDDGRYGPQNWLGLTSPQWFNVRDFVACPAATKSSPDGRYYNAFTAWWWEERGPVATGPSGEPILGPVSYSFNCCVSWPPPDDPRAGVSHKQINWATCDVRGAAAVPVLFDCAWEDGGASDCIGPPLGDMRLFLDAGWRMCINRHEGGINMLFMDWSARTAGLKELWTLKWHRRFNTANPWTKQGGVEPEDWPPWMRKFKDY